MNLIRTTMAVVASGVISIALAPYASADNGPSTTAKWTCVHHGDDYACAKGKKTKVCDLEYDGHGVEGRFKLKEGRAAYSDYNGSKEGCSTDTHQTVVKKLRVCEKTVGCSRWKKV